ncbi:MAG: aldo/keto reductase [Deltaproteobacteria bacterium]
MSRQMVYAPSWRLTMVQYDDGKRTRRQALSGLLAGAAAVACSTGAQRNAAEELPPLAVGEGEPGQAPPPAAMGRAVTDQVALGSTGIQVSRLAMGSGTHGYGGASDQTRLGLTGFSSLLVDSFERGITFWETADQYGAHRHVAAALRQVGRQNVVALTKSHAETAADMQADLERFLQELGTDYLDVVLLHAKESARWTEQCAGAMEYLEGAKQRGLIRAHGVSCHTLAALELAAATPWVDVDFARINPFGLHMDADPATVKGVLERMKSAGKGVIGMKILGQGDAVGRFDEAIEHAVRLDCIDGFTIGFVSNAQLEQVTTKVQSV